MDTPQEVASYSSMNHQVVSEAFVDRLIQLGAQGRMLDLGTGPGDFPFKVVSKIPNAHVHGIDLAHHMIALAEKQKQKQSDAIAQKIKFSIMDVTDLQFQDNTFDCVFSNTILHHLPDPRPMLTQALRVLKPQGVLLIRDLYRPSDPQSVEKILERHARQDTPQQRQLLADSLHAAFEPGELWQMLQELNIKNVQVVIDSDRHISLQRLASNTQR